MNQIKPGDIRHIQEQTHHFTILTPPVDGKVLTINVNSMYKGNEVKERPIDLVKGEGLGGRLPGLTRCAFAGRSSRCASADTVEAPCDSG